MRPARRILVTGARAPAAVEMASLLRLGGIEVHVADSTPLLLAAGARAATAGHRLPQARANLDAYGRAVVELVVRERIDCVVPTCEEVFFLAAARDAGFAIPLLAPPLATLRTLHDKHAFIRLAAEAGIEAPRTILLRSISDLAQVIGDSRSLVFKPCFSRFGVETRIGPSPGAARSIRPTTAEPWVAQERIDGEEFCGYGLARGGRLVAFAAYRPLYRMGKAASYFFERVDLPEGEDVAARVAAATGFDGQIAFDFMRQTDGRLVPIECNPRATSGIHLFAGLPSFAERLLGDAVDLPMLRPLAGDVAPMLGSAMLLFGAPRALGRGFPTWLRDFRRGRDVLRTSGDWLNARALAVLVRYVVEAIVTRSPLRAIATADIEWNGEPLDARG